MSTGSLASFGFTWSLFTGYDVSSTETGRVLKKTSVDPQIPQFKCEDLGNKEEIGRGSFGAVYRTSLGEKELVVKKTVLCWR